MPQSLPMKPARARDPKWQAYLGWEHTGWAQRAPPHWCRPSTGCRWRETVSWAGRERCCPTRLILPGLTEPAGRGRWWGRSGRIKCCLEVAEGTGRGGRDRHTTPRRVQTSTQHAKTDAHHPRHTDTKKETGTAVRNLEAPSLLSGTLTCMCIRADKHAYICARRFTNTDGVMLGRTHYKVKCLWLGTI